jgi:restriction endonuclease Mrr
MWWSTRHPCQAQTKRLRLHDRSDNYLDTHRLVDGIRLAGLMIECEVGVTARVVKIPKIDGDYFDEEAA